MSCVSEIFDFVTTPPPLLPVYISLGTPDRWWQVVEVVAVICLIIDFAKFLDPQYFYINLKILNFREYETI